MKTKQKRSLPVMGALALLAACGPATPPGPTAEELRADPVKTREIMRLCREQRDQVSDETCAAARVARREQDMASGGAKYTPGGVEPKPAGEDE